MTETENEKKRGLVLEGGGMRGLYTAGVLDVWMENDITMDIVVGVSAGAVFGCNYKSVQPGRVLRYNKRFCRDKRFVSVRNWLKTGSIYTKEFAYGKVPFELDVFDSKTYEKNPMDFYVVATNALTGKAAYHLCPKGDEEDIEWMRASAAIPMACKPVPLEGAFYVDGGVADSIPVQWMAKKGCEKLVTVLTRPAGYRKEPRKTDLLTKTMLRKYPKLIEAMRTRHKRYNAALDFIAKKETEGSMFVLRPSEPIDMPMLSQTPEDLERVYRLGRKNAQEELERLKEFLL